MKLILALLATVLLVSGCNDMSSKNGTTSTDRNSSPSVMNSSPDGSSPNVNNPGPSVNNSGQSVDNSAANVDRDNTAVNERDRNSAAKTPIDQNENKKDVDITASIRKKVVDTKMSTNAQNVKIITQDGKVTLRGPVKSADEKQTIEKIARSVAGDDNVDSQLEVEQQP